MFDWFKRMFGGIEKKPRTSSRMYGAAKQSRLTTGWGVTNSSADSELHQSLTGLRSRSRQLIRDASYAKRARTLVVNNVVGNGIGLQAQVKGARGGVLKRVNQEIEDAWKTWSKAQYCHTGGRLHFKMFERQVMAQVFEAGDCFIRMHPIRFGDSPVPLALELIESERVTDEYTAPFMRRNEGTQIRMGVEVDDRYQRPVAYHIRNHHPGEFQYYGEVGFEEVERVPAEYIIHVGMIDRWPQTRGEPWLHAAARRLNDLDGYSEAEIVKARVQASMPFTIETPQASTSLGEEQEDGSVEMTLEPGIAQRLSPGEKFNNPPPAAPNTAMDPFMRYMLREIASGVGVSYESLSRDYSQSNYSSSRLALLDDRDLWRVLQTWFICDFRERLHDMWMQQAVLSRAVPSVSIEDFASNPSKFTQVRFKPRGWTWVDPSKEISAFQDSIKSGFSTVSDVIAQTGGGLDLQDVLEQREQELALMKEKGIVFETSPEFYKDKKPNAAKPKSQPTEPDEDDTPRIYSVRK